MTTTLVHVNVTDGFQDAFIRASVKNCAASRQELGNLRFDLLQSVDDPCKFILVEAYSDADSARAHKETAHYLEWRDTVAPMMATPRQGEPFRLLEP